MPVSARTRARRRANSRSVIVTAPKGAGAVAGSGIGRTAGLTGPAAVASSGGSVRDRPRRLTHAPEDDQPRPVEDQGDPAVAEDRGPPDAVGRVKVRIEALDDDLLLLEQLIPEGGG